jgi:hypothetical protein
MTSGIRKSGADRQHQLSHIRMTSVPDALPEHCVRVGSCSSWQRSRASIFCLGIVILPLLTALGDELTRLVDNAGFRVVELVSDRPHDSRNHDRTVDERRKARKAARRAERERERVPEVFNVGGARPPVGPRRRSA